MAGAERRRARARPEPESLLQAFDALLSDYLGSRRADYAAASVSRYVRKRTGLGGAADAHLTAQGLYRPCKPIGGRDTRLTYSFSLTLIEKCRLQD